jgi:hypothetical protein
MGCIKLLKPHLNGLHKNPEASSEWVAYQHIAYNKVASKSTWKRRSGNQALPIAALLQLFKFASIFCVIANNNFNSRPCPHWQN